MACMKNSSRGLIINGLRNFSSSTRVSNTDNASEGNTETTTRQLRMNRSVYSLMDAEKTGRHSFNGSVATVFGSRGFIGGPVVGRLCRRGTQLILPYSGDPYFYRFRKPNADLGQMFFTPFYMKDEASVRKTMTHSDTVINLIGRDYQTKNFSFEDVNINGPRLVAKIARECGVKRLIWLSHINAREQPEKAFLPGGSKWLKTKWLGEKAILEEFPDATIIRCSDVFGEMDNFINDYLQRSRVRYGYVPLFRRGEGILKCPVFSTDLVNGIIRCLELDQTKGQIIEAHGPHYFILSELLDHMMQLSMPFVYRGRVQLYSPKTVMVMCRAIMANTLPVSQRMWRNLIFDKLERGGISDRIEGYTNLTELGVKYSSTLDEMTFFCVNRPLVSHTTVTSSFYRPELERPEAIPISQGREFLSQRGSVFLPSSVN